jgi:hypothetical protein
MHVLYSLSDRLCHLAGVHSDEGVRHRRLFELGHQVGELGWRLRTPARTPSRGIPPTR